MHGTPKRWSCRVKQRGQLQNAIADRVATKAFSGKVIPQRILVACTVALFTSAAIHLHLLLTVAPVVLAMLLWSAKVWQRKKMRKHVTIGSLALLSEERGTFGAHWSKSGIKNPRFKAINS